MPFKAVYKKDFYISNNKIFLSDEYVKKNSFKFKKITGSRFSSILMQNKYSSPLKTWAIMTNIYYEEMDETLSKVGNLIEPKIRNYVSDLLKIDFLCYDPREVKWDIFKKNNIFGGIPDGEPINNNKDFLYKEGYPMLEIKTTSIDSFVYKNTKNFLEMCKDKDGYPLVKEKNGKIDSWINDNKLVVPIDYQIQLGLYLYLRKTSIGLFSVAFLEKENYLYPMKYDVYNNIILSSLMMIDEKEFSKLIEYSKDWYNNHIIKGVSPIINSNDLLWLKKELNV